MKKLLSLLLVLLLLTGCAAQPPVEPESQSTNTVPETDVVESTSVTEESDPKENATEESVPTEELSTPEDSTPADIVSEVISLEAFDLLVRIQPYDWYGAPEPDGPGVDFGTVALTEDQKAALEILLHPNKWEPTEIPEGIGLNVVMCLENSATGEQLSICPGDGFTLVVRSFSNGRKAQIYYRAPIWLLDDAKIYMYDAAYASWPDPQTLADLSGLCRYPDTLSAEYRAHLSAMEINAVETIDVYNAFADAHHALYAPYLYTSLLPLAWENADDIPTDNLMRFFAVNHFGKYVADESFLIDMLIVESNLQQYYDVTAQHLRTAENFIRDAGCYRFNGMDGRGGMFPQPALLQRIGENCWRMYTAFDMSSNSTPQLEYSAFEFELTDTGFRYLRGLGDVPVETVPLPAA